MAHLVVRSAEGDPAALPLRLHGLESRTARLLVGSSLPVYDTMKDG